MDLPPGDDLRERLAERTHENWAAARRRQGWRHGPSRNDATKEHPSLVAYAALSDEEKNIDREVTEGVLTALQDLGLQVTAQGFDTFREYELIAESTQFLTERRQAAAHTYLSVNTAIFAILGLLIEKVELPGFALGVASLPLLAAGAISCLVWQKALHHYRTLNAWRYQQLIAIEQSAAMRGSHRLYTREWNEYDRTVREKGFPFSTLEASLPKMFLALYVAFIIGVLVVLVVLR